jgi:hypothetical protein
MYSVVEIAISGSGVDVTVSPLLKSRLDLVSIRGVDECIDVGCVILSNYIFTLYYYIQVMLESVQNHPQVFPFVLYRYRSLSDVQHHSQWIPQVKVTPRRN